MAEPVNTGKKLHVYEADSEDVAKQASSHGAVEGGIVFVKEAGKDTGKIYKDGVAYGGGGSGEDEKFDADADSAGVTIGGLEEGTSLANKTVKEVVEGIVYPEFAPYFVDASSGIVCKQNNTNVATVQEVGNNTPAQGDYTISGSSAKCIGKASKYEASNGTPSNVQTVQASTCGTTSYNAKTTQAGYFTVRNTSTCADGTVQVKTNKGNATNKTGGSATSRTLLTKASANTTNLKTVDGVNVVKGTSKTADHTIYYRYKLYASTDTAGVATNKGISSASAFDWTLKAGNAGQIIAVPSSYKTVKIYEYNATLNSWTDVTDGWTATEDTTTYKDASNTAVAYKVYKRNKAAGDDTKFRLTFSV